MAIRRTLPHTVQNAPPTQNAAERKHSGQGHAGTGKKPETPFSQVLSAEQGKHAHRDGTGESDAPKPELSVPVDPRNLLLIMREAQAQTQPAQGNESKPSHPPSPHRHRIMPDSDYGLSGRKKELVWRMLQAQRAKLDEGQLITSQFSSEIGMQLEILKELKAKLWEAKKLFNKGDVAGAVQCIANMEPIATKLSKRVQDARKGKINILLPTQGADAEKELESSAARIARLDERKRVAALYSVRIGHSLNQPAQGILGEIDILNVVQKTPTNVSAALANIEKNLQIFSERAEKIRSVKEIQEEHYDKGVKMLRID